MKVPLSSDRRSSHTSARCPRWVSPRGETRFFLVVYMGYKSNISLRRGVDNGSCSKHRFKICRTDPGPPGSKLASQLM